MLGASFALTPAAPRAARPPAPPELRPERSGDPIARHRPIAPLRRAIASAVSMRLAGLSALTGSPARRSRAVRRGRRAGPAQVGGTPGPGSRWAGWVCPGSLPSGQVGDCSVRHRIRWRQGAGRWFGTGRRRSGRPQPGRPSAGRPQPGDPSLAASPTPMVASRSTAID